MAHDGLRAGGERPPIEGKALSPLRSASAVHIAPGLPSDWRRPPIQLLVHCLDIANLEEDKPMIGGKMDVVNQWVMWL